MNMQQHFLLPWVATSAAGSGGIQPQVAPAAAAVAGAPAQQQQQQQPHQKLTGSLLAQQQQQTQQQQQQQQGCIYESLPNNLQSFMITQSCQFDNLFHTE